MLQAPLEQFEILQIIPIYLFIFDFSVTNFLIINLLAFLSFIIFIYFNGVQKNTILVKKSYFQKAPLFFVISNPWQKIIELAFDVVAKLIVDTIFSSNDRFFPLILIIFNFIFFSNLIGLIPYSFTATSHLIITFSLSFTVFIGINIITFKKYNLQIFALFLPANTTFLLALLLVPIEFLSYIAKPISLGIRLFINLMAGHSLLKVIIGFSWSILLLENIGSIGLMLPMIVLIFLFGLELGVALIQTYVFIILTCIYIQDGS
jgi:ATP synthase subunit 6